MLSRPCSRSQIYVLDEFDESKMYPSTKALAELERLNDISLNKNPTDWEKDESQYVKISSLNCRSLKKHYQDIKADSLLLKSDLISLQETWLDENTYLEDLYLPNFTLKVVSYGRGKGIATYFRTAIFTHKEDVKDSDIQLSKLTSNDFDVIVLYRSSSAKFDNLKKKLAILIDLQRPTLIIGDFNFCFFSKDTNCTKQYLSYHNFKQLIEEPTHIEGNLIDHAYLRDISGVLQTKSELHSKYYSDHRGLAIMISKGKVV